MEINFILCYEGDNHSYAGDNIRVSDLDLENMKSDFVGKSLYLKVEDNNEVVGKITKCQILHDNMGRRYLQATADTSYLPPAGPWEI
ncbi:MAG: hypothetical protein WC476_01520 [Phycisphaerae bacterium]|jgi:hypothetical protein